MSRGRATLTLVDTSIFVDVLRAHEPAVEWLAAMNPDHVRGSVVSLAELVVGVRSGQRRGMRRLLRLVEWLPVDEPVALQAGEWGRRYRRSHSVDLPDLLIGATAEAHGLELITRNLKHFPMIEGARSPY